MDPLSAIGLASAIVQFVQFGFQIADRLHELTSTHPGQIPKALQGISMHLPLLANSLSKIKSDSRISAFDFDTKCILKGIVSGCLAQVQEVEAMLEEISCTPGDSLRSKLKKVMASMKYEEKLTRIERNLNTYISVLILHHVVDSTDAPRELVEETYYDVREKLTDKFVQRKNLIEQLDSHFYDASRSQVTSPTVLLLSGKKGAGKTQLALGYCRAAYELRQFRTVFWLDASTVENLSLGFERMYATVRQSTQGSRIDKIAFMRNFLEDLWHPWLLVLDNYESAHLYNNIMDFLPSRGYGAVLLISEDVVNGLGEVLCVPTYRGPHEQDRLDSLLQAAVQNRDLPAIKQAVEQGANVDTMIWGEWPCIHRVSLFGMDDALQYLLDHGANLNMDVKVEPTLYWGASGGSENVCRLLLDCEDKQLVHFSPATYQSSFQTAVENGHVEVVKMLIERRNVNLSLTNRYGESPLANAADKGKTELIKFLIGRGVIRDDKISGEKALKNAVSRGHLEAVKVLCQEGGVSTNLGSWSDENLLAFVGESRYDENTLAIAEYLLENGAHPDSATGQDGLLHKVCLREEMDFLKLVLRYNPDPTIIGSPYCPLQYAVGYDHPEVVDILLGIKMNDAEKRKAWINSALLVAAIYGRRGATLRFLDEGADIDTRYAEGNRKGATPLLLATLEGHVQTAQFLVRRKASQDIASDLGDLPLAVAARKGHHLLVRDLIRAGGDPNLKSGENENTLLMVAVAAKHQKVVEVLLKNGADAEVSNKFGEIALDIAEEKDYEDIIKLLESI